MKSLCLSIALTAAAMSASAAEISLYPTGPAEDASFIRFVSTLQEEVSVASAQGSVALSVDLPATAFQAVAAGKRIKGEVIDGDRRAPIGLEVAAGEFVTVVVLETDHVLGTQVLREQPDDFNALKASVGFVNLSDRACVDARLKVAGRNLELLAAGDAGQVQRRLVNPLSLEVELECGGLQIGEPLSLGRLEAGERYSVMVVPDAGSARLVFAQDRLAP